jgi:hypothetical protein
MKGITWSRDSHGLFDYESRHLTKRAMKTLDPVQIVRKQNELELVPLANEQEVTINDPEIKPLLNIIKEDGKLYEFDLSN